MPAAAAFNFKRAMRVLLWLITKAVFMPAKTQSIRLIDNSNRIG
jgi:hypothetical protein